MKYILGLGLLLAFLVRLTLRAMQYLDRPFCLTR